MKKLRVFRRFANGEVLVLGTTVEYEQGWRFVPRVSGRSASRKYWPNWEKSLPKWVGYPNSCETESL